MRTTSSCRSCGLLLNYYESRQPVSYTRPELLATLDDRVRQVVVTGRAGDGRTGEERIDLTWFRLGGNPDT